MRKSIRVATGAALTAVVAAGIAVTGATSASAWSESISIAQVDGSTDSYGYIAAKSEKPTFTAWARQAGTVRFIWHDKVLCETDFAPQWSFPSCKSTVRLDSGYQEVRAELVTADGTVIGGPASRIGIPGVAPHELRAVRSGDVTTVTGEARRNIEVRASVQGTGTVVEGRTDAEGAFSLQLRDAPVGATIEVQDGPVSGWGRGLIAPVTVEAGQPTGDAAPTETAATATTAAATTATASERADSTGADDLTDLSAVYDRATNRTVVSGTAKPGAIVVIHWDISGGVFARVAADGTFSEVRRGKADQTVIVWANQGEKHQVPLQAS